ncbi:MAG: GAF domain-containing protein [Cryobacterium sp.]|nr:GAF domain-containing protein [Oligoflexia bacterium]
MESLVVPQSLSKKEKYEALLLQVASLLKGERDLVANLANLSAALKTSMGFFWVGFYLVRKSLMQKPPGAKSGNSGSDSSHGELVLGPFQGPVACTRIPYGKGVCGTAWARGSALIVPDVEKFSGHIACSSEAKSEIVLPFYLHPELQGHSREIMGVLDVDSDQLNAFDAVDELYLNQILMLLY